MVDRRATEPASLERNARAPVMGPSGAHRPSATRRTTPPLKSSLKDGKGNNVKFVKLQRVQTKTPKHQKANDSEDDSDSSIGSDSSMSVEAAPRALI